MEQEDFEAKCRACNHPLVQELFDRLYNSPVNNRETNLKMMWETVFKLQESEKLTFGQLSTEKHLYEREIQGLEGRILELEEYFHLNGVR